VPPGHCLENISSSIFMRNKYVFSMSYKAFVFVSHFFLLYNYASQCFIMRAFASKLHSICFGA